MAWIYLAISSSSPPLLTCLVSGILEISTFKYEVLSSGWNQLPSGDTKHLYKIPTWNINAFKGIESNIKVRNHCRNYCSLLCNKVFMQRRFPMANGVTHRAKTKTHQTSKETIRKKLGNIQAVQSVELPLWTPLPRNMAQQILTLRRDVGGCS